MWHDPDHASRGAPVVRAPSHDYGYGVAAPPGSWGRGIPGTRASTGGSPLYSFSRLPVPDPTLLEVQNKASPIRVIGGVIYFVGLLYLFFSSIELMSTAFTRSSERRSFCRVCSPAPGA